MLSRYSKNCALLGGLDQTKNSFSKKLSSKESEPYATVVNCTWKPPLWTFILLHMLESQSCVGKVAFGSTKQMTNEFHLCLVNWRVDLGFKHCFVHYCQAKQGLSDDEKKSTLSQWKVTWYASQAFDWWPGFPTKSCFTLTFTLPGKKETYLLLP